MDDVAFRASVFAEQKQLAAFSSHAPADRRKLVLQLLGITPLDAAREQARKDARAANDQLVRTRAVLPDLGQLAEEITRAEATAAEAAQAHTAAATLADAAKQGWDGAATALEKLADIGREYDALVREGKALRQQRDRSAARQGELEQELAALETAAGQLVSLSARAEGLEEAEARLSLLKEVAAAAAALARLPSAEAPARPEDLVVEVDAAREAAQSARSRVAELEGRLAAGRAALSHTQEVAERSLTLSGEADCPVCGQSLGEAFEQVQAHRRQELEAARASVAALERDQVAAARQAEESAAADRELARRLEATRQAWATYEKAAERRQAALEAHAGALAAAVAIMGREPAPGEEADLARSVAEGRAADRECGVLRGRLERRPAAESELAAEKERLATLDSELQNLRDKVRSLAFEPQELARRRSETDLARQRSEAASADAQRLAATAAAATATAEGHGRRLADAEAQHARLEEAAEESRHLGRLADLLNVFRNTVVASVGPRLSAQAADLFSELTDAEYDRLEVDPDTYEIQIRDGGIAYGMDRFSGSETDLANLALRVAISEHVRFQSGGVVGLLVLDEVFGPLDEERKERMLLALERLRSRFRQVLVVTHAPEIKDQLPSAIEVVKRPGRRATARLVNP